MKKMKRIFIFEAGSSKTSLAHNVDDLKITLTYPGYNPNRTNKGFLESIDQLPSAVFEDAHIYFYGSGLRQPAKQLEIKTYFKERFQTNIEVFDDVLGAARALLLKKEGVIGIMGTGACVAYYDGRNIIESTGGHGYLIDDIGGGYELGKLITSYWLNGQMNAAQDKSMADHFGVSRTDFTSYYYLEKDLNSVAQVVRLINDFKTNDIEQLLLDYFDIFFKRHVNSILEKYNTNEISFVGSISSIFNAEIVQVAQSNGIKVTSINQFPVNALLNFHLNNLTT